MKITSLHLANLKGMDDQIVPLTGLDIFLGPNGSGKTRLLQSLQLALAGVVPHSIEERNIDLLELFTKREGVESMEVSVDLAEGAVSEIVRSFDLTRKNGKDGVTQTIETVPPVAKGMRDYELKIKEVLGDFPFMLDVHKFIRLSDEQRAALIFQFSPVDPAKWSAVTIFERIEAALETFEKKYAAVDRSEVAAICKNLNAYFTGDVQSGIKFSIDYLKAQISELRKSIRGNEGAGLASLQMNDVDGKQALRHVEDITTDISSSRNQERELITKIADARSTKDAIGRLDSEKSTLRLRIQTEKAKTDETKLAAIRKALADTEAKIVPVTDEDRTEIELKETELRAYQQELQLRTADCNQARQTLDQSEKRIAQIKSGHCPTCGQETIALLGSMTEETDTLRDQVFALREQMAQLQNSVAVAQKALTDQSSLIRQRERDNSGYLAIVNESKQTLAKLEGAAEGIATLEARLTELERTNVKGELINIDEAEMHLAGIKQRIATLEAELREKQGYDTKLSMAKEAAVRAKRSEETVELLKELYAELQSIRWQIVRDALEPIRQDASELFNVVTAENDMQAEFDFQFTDARGNEVFKFGWKVKGLLGDMFIDFDSLSTAQQIFTLISLLAPLIHRANPKLRLLMLDNLEVVHESYRESFIELAISAKNSFLDNLLIASSAEYPDMPGINIVRCGEKQSKGLPVEANA